MSCIFHHNDKHGKTKQNKKPYVLKRNINPDGDWLVRNTGIASEDERTTSSALDNGSVGGSQVARVFVVLTDMVDIHPPSC